MICIGLCGLLCCCASAALAENLAVNGGFEQMNGDYPAKWVPGMWQMDEGISYVERSGEAYEGEASGFVENVSPNDARWEQRIAVTPKTLYRFRCMVRAEGCDPANKGANLSVKDIYGTSPDVHDTKGAWVPIELYGYTGADQKELVLMARLGGYGSETIGKAWFDAVEVEAVEAADIPAGAEVLPSLKAEPTRSEAKTATGKPGIEVFWLLMLVGAAFIVLAVGVRRAAMHPSPLMRAEDRLWPHTVWALLGLALVLRVVVALLSPGYATDVGCFNAWSARMVDMGPGRFYQDGYFCDYPPGYLLVLWLNGATARGLAIFSDNVLSRLIFRGAPILCDLCGAYLLYRISRKQLGDRAALGLLALYAFNPAAIVTGAAWGQVDAVLALGLACTVWLVVRRKWQWALPVYTLCVLLKPQALMAGPLGLLALIIELVQDRENMRHCLRRVGVGAAAALLLAAAVVLPFWGQQQPDWLIRKYAGTMGYYDYATVNAANLFYLLGGNWTKFAQPVFFGITWQVLGIVGMALVFACVVALYLRAKEAGMLWSCSALLFAGLFLFGMMMHERYLLPAILLLGGAYAYKRDVRTLIVLVGYSVTMLINTGMVLAFEHLIAPHVWIGKLLAAVNLLLFALQVWTAWEQAWRGRVREQLWPPKRREAKQNPKAQTAYNAYADALLHPRDHRLRLTRFDGLILAAITLAYSALAFQGLGETRAPQEFWQPGSPQEQVIFDLEESREFVLYYYGGISPTAFTIATSEDGEEWSQEFNARLDGGECFRWQAYAYPQYDENGEQKMNAQGEAQWQSGPVDAGKMQARYLRLTASGAGLSLGEVAFHNLEGGVWPIAEVRSGSGVTERSQPLAMLTDEQDTVPELPGYLNGTYFDEIYHARTGYEHLNNIHTFEWTHPPLGKVLIMLAIQVFGMTPFGWRFAGTLIGVLMLPAMYLLAKQLWKRTDAAVFTTLLLALDCMHFTQSRIATIDSYPVLFIMLMYLFMFRYAQMSIYHQPLRKTLLPLALSGLATALAIASKWIGLYAATGLALIFFYTVYRRIAERRYAVGTGDEALIRQTENCARDVSLTLAWCVLWFIVVPALIYYFSYYWQLRPDGGLSWERFWNTQESMFRYHSQLKDSHPYQSKWSSWPIIGKPMWYYSTQRLAGGKASTILAFGNPAVWWGGLVALLTTLALAVVYAVRDARARLARKAADFGEWQRDMLRVAAMLLIGFAAQYVPWMLVPRSTYIYHYFASVPFIILCMGQCALWGFRGREKLGRWVCVGYLLLTLIAFIGYFPFASGVPMSIGWAEAMQWAFRLPY